MTLENLLKIGNRLLDVFRVKRNAIDYTGEGADLASVEEAVKTAEMFQKHIVNWLSENKPDLVLNTNRSKP